MAKSKLSNIALLGSLIVIGINIIVFIVFGYPEIMNYVDSNKILSSSEKSIPDQNTTNDHSNENKELNEVISLENTNNYKSPENNNNDGIILLSLTDGYFKHIFAYHPQTLPLNKITDGEDDDVDPELSPDGNFIAYASNKNGYWDIYKLNLSNGNEIQLTNTPEYDGSPTWSPDGQWLAYESYVNYNLEIVLVPTSGDENQKIQLTDNQASDHSPKWSPTSRKIVFVSDRTGDCEIWIADLDQKDNRFKNISNRLSIQDKNPIWSPDGEYIAWSTEYENNRTILLNKIDSEKDPEIIGSGNRPIFSPSGNLILSEINYPNSNAITIYSVDDKQITLPLTYIHSQSFGLDWNTEANSHLIYDLINDPTESYIPPKMLIRENNSTDLAIIGRSKLAQLSNITAPYPFLHNDVYQSFSDLRIYISEIAGWDFLKSLENAYIPLTESLKPGMENNWLLTGRAFALNSLPLDAGWVKIMKEDINGEVYWRVFIKTRYQDGSQGEPLKDTPWDLTARYQGDTLSYENGGKYEQTTAGYWIDFTEIALRFGWNRKSAQNNWRTYFPGTRFNIFVQDNNLNWYDALLEIYPEEIILEKNY